MSDRLGDYRAKRDFAVTGEPAGGESAAPAQRFVVQEHHARRLHWDLRLERDGVLASWAVPKGLPEAPGSNHFAARTEDHPLEYIDFHGEIPPGQYGAGTMKIWDHGTYETLKWEPRKVEVALHGERLDARYALFAIGKEDAPKDWMVHRMDPPADPSRQPMPRTFAPMRARPGRAAPDGPDWAHEIRWQGERAIAFSQPGELRFEGADLSDLTPLYPELGRLGRALGSRSAVLDGVIVGGVVRGGVGSPAQIRRLAAAQPATFVIFDLLWLDGHALVSLPYRDRRERLAALELAGERWRTPDHVVGAAAAVLETSAAHGLDGIVAKRLDSAYQPGRRSPDWVEVSHGAAAAVAGGREVTVTVDGRARPLSDLGDYYAAVAPTLARHVAGRGLTLEHEVELHAPLALMAAPDRPTAVVFDLVPGAPATIADCCEVALRLHGMLEQLGLTCLAKTSGGAGGLQVLLPLGGAPTFAATSAFAKLVAGVLAADEPELVVAGTGPAAGRVLLDWTGNDRRATTIVAYSLRAGPRVSVSTPLDWDEVDGSGPDLVFDPAQVLARIERLGDLFAPAASLDQALPRL
jgi:bifunctional non-homologous end joining protein LigD